MFALWALVTDGDTNDVRIAQTLTFAPGTIVAIDRGYWDYALYLTDRLTEMEAQTKNRSTDEVQLLCIERWPHDQWLQRACALHRHRELKATKDK